MKTGRPTCPIIRSSQEKLHIRIGKTYLAIVRSWAPEALVIDHPLVEKDRPPSEMQPVRVPPAQPAITDLRRLATVELSFPAGPHPTCRWSLWK